MSSYLGDGDAKLNFGFDELWLDLEFSYLLYFAYIKKQHFKLCFLSIYFAKQKILHYIVHLIENPLECYQIWNYYYYFHLLYSLFWSSFYLLVRILCTSKF